MKPTKAGYTMLSISVLLNSITVLLLAYMQFLGQ